MFNALLKALLILFGIALLLPGIYAVLLMTPLLAGETAPAAIWWLCAAALTVSAGGIWLIRYALRNR